MPKSGAGKESYNITAKEEIIKEGRVNNGTMTEMNKPYEFDDDMDEMKVVMKPSMRQILQIKIPGEGQIKFGIKMGHFVCNNVGQDLTQ